MDPRTSISSLALAALLCASAARAQVPQEADPRYAQGVTLRAQHRDAEALEVFRAIEAETHAPHAAASMALAEGALGRWVDAEARLAGALARADDTWIRANRATLEAALQTMRGHLGELEVSADVAGAELWIARARVATLPMTRPVRVAAGAVSFEVRAPGRVTVARAVSVAAGSTARERVAFASPLASRGEASAAPPSPGSLQRALGWSAVGAAGLFLVGGAIGYGLGADAAAAYNDDPGCPGDGAPSQPPACAERLDRARTMQSLEVAGFVGAGVFGVVAAVLLATAPSAGRERAALRCARLPGAAGINCAVEF